MSGNRAAEGEIFGFDWGILKKERGRGIFEGRYSWLKRRLMGEGARVRREDIGIRVGRGGRMIGCEGTAH